MRPDVLAGHVALTVRNLFQPLEERVAALEARAPVPGPPGPPGPPGEAGLRYLGVHVTDKAYDIGDLVTAGGSAWYCGRSTQSTPGTSPDWQLMVKRGRDARSR